jgi:4-hydroxy-2-oxoglutarate aldolase
MNLTGLFLPLTTPFDGDGVAPERLAENIARYARHEPAGYLLLGSTGEAAHLSEEEKVAVLRAARAAIPAARTMLAGTGLESTAATVRMTRIAADAGADGALVVTPHYFRARMTEEALVRHFAAVADASPIPVLLYNVPVYTGIVIPPAAVERVARHDNVAGLKDSSGDLGWMLEVLARVPASFQVLSGSAYAFQPALEAGAVGGILAFADACPEPCGAIHKLHCAGDREGALRVQRCVVIAARAILAAGIAGVKGGMDLRGLHGGSPRAPLLPLTTAERDTVRITLDHLVSDGVLPSLQL